MGSYNVMLSAFAFVLLTSLVYSQDCGTLTSPTNGIVDVPTTTLNSVATYTCDAGYNLQGASTRTCQNDGNWDGATPTCAINDCGGLPNPTDGTVNTPDGTTYLEVATYACDTGYTLVGDTTRTCQTDGTWSSTAPTCQIRDCGNLSNPSNGLVSTGDGTTFGDTATYMCNVGYNLNGSSSRTCSADGTWSNSVPVCIIKDCGSPSAIANGGYAISMTTFRSTVTYSCNANYAIVGSETITCLSTGMWDSNTPTCQIDCGVPASITGGSVSSTGGTAVGALATYTCDAGYTLSGGSTITCEASGSWSSGPSCMINLASYNSTCSSASDCQTDRVSCLDDGSGTSRCICSSTTVYDSSLDSCLSDCGGLSDPTNGVVTVPTQTIEGQIATYTCNAGYAISGSDSRTCQASGQWSGTAPTCTTGCSEPDPPVNGQVNTTNGFTTGSVITYSCNTGYTLVGSVSRTCLVDMSWDGQAPTCNKECAVLTEIEHGTVDLSLGNWAGSVATYICDKDYALLGQSTRKCQTTGLWSGTEPSCNFAMFPDILIVFGVFITLLIVVDIAVLGVYLYKYVYKAKPSEEEDKDDEESEPYVEEKKTQFSPFMLDRPDDVAVPPLSFMHAQGRKNKYSKIAPEVIEDPEVRMRTTVHPPPRKPPFGQARVEKIERPSFMKSPRDKPAALGREKTFDSTTFGPGKDRFKSDMMPKAPESGSFYPPNSVVQQTPKSPKQTNEAEDIPGKDGYYTGNSDDSHHRRAPSPAEADQMSLDDFDIPDPKANSTMDRARLSSNHGFEY